MKKKFNFKTVVILGVMLVVIVLGVIAIGQVRNFMSGATSDVEPANVVATSAVDGKTATITWTSDKESVAKVEYGTTAASLVLMTADTTATASHNLTLNQLRPATTYYYRIKIGDEIFDNGGIPYSFKTKGESETAVVSPTVAVTVTPVVTKAVCNPETDYNNDGVVNSIDLMTCKNSGGTVQSSTQAAGSKVLNSTAECDNLIADYNSDGVINSLDRINCLQTKR
jgi:phosphodiesterase/alkaline phosphatase D-like protein